MATAADVRYPAISLNSTSSVDERRSFPDPDFLFEENMRPKKPFLLFCCDPSFGSSFSSTSAAPAAKALGERDDWRSVVRLLL